MLSQQHTQERKWPKRYGARRRSRVSHQGPNSGLRWLMRSRWPGERLRGSTAPVAVSTKDPRGQRNFRIPGCASMLSAKSVRVLGSTAVMMISHRWGLGITATASPEHVRMRATAISIDRNRGLREIRWCINGLGCDLVCGRRRIGDLVRRTELRLPLPVACGTLSCLATDKEEVAHHQTDGDSRYANYDCDGSASLADTCQQLGFLHASAPASSLR